MASSRSKPGEIVAPSSTPEGPRSHLNRRHPPPGAPVIAALAALAGPAGPAAIARRAEFKGDLLAGIPDPPHGVPGEDAFRRAPMPLKPAAFEAAFDARIARLRDGAAAETGADRPVISLDGETARRGHDAGGGSARRTSSPPGPASAGWPRGRRSVPRGPTRSPRSPHSRGRSTPAAAS